MSSKCPCMRQAILGLVILVEQVSHWFVVSALALRLRRIIFDGSLRTRFLKGFCADADVFAFGG